METVSKDRFKSSMAYLQDLVSKEQVDPDRLEGLPQDEALHSVASALCEIRRSLETIEKENVAYYETPLKGYIGDMMRQLMTRLREVTKSINKVAELDFSHSLSSGGKLAKNFNVMKDRLETILDELNGR